MSVLLATIAGKDNLIVTATAFLKRNYPIVQNPEHVEIVWKLKDEVRNFIRK